MLYWISNQLISTPAIWGKLPVQGDFIRYHTNQLQVESWQDWIEHHVVNSVTANSFLLPAIDLPISFVIAPKQLPFSSTRFVVGVITKSIDKSGRKYPIVIYQQASYLWVKQNFNHHLIHKNGWLFWLARLLYQYLSENDDKARTKTLPELVEQLWLIHAPQWSILFSLAQSADQEKSAQCIGDLPDDALMRNLKGISHFPLYNWVEQLLHGKITQMYWQQDASGGFVMASDKISDLWSVGK